MAEDRLIKDDSEEATTDAEATFKTKEQDIKAGGGGDLRIPEEQKSKKSDEGTETTGAREAPEKRGADAETTFEKKEAEKK